MILIDSSVLLDLLDSDSGWYPWSFETVGRAVDESVVAINPIIYAETSLRFADPDEFDEAFPESIYVRRPLPYSAAFLAGKAHFRYRKRGGMRLSTLPDFFIGAHAAVAGYALITRDPRRFRRYFPTVDLIAP